MKSLLVVAFLLYCFLLVESARTRKPWNDEAMAASAAYTLASKGYLGTPVFDDSFLLHIQKVTYYIFPLQLFVLSIWDRLAGFSLFSMRALSMIWAFVALFAIYRLMRIWSGDRLTALLAACLAAIDYQFMLAASFGRYDMMVAALGYGAYAVFLSLRERRFPAAILLSNACTMAAAATHPNALVYLLGLWFLILYYDRGRLNLRVLVLAAAPYALGAGIWGAYLLQDTQAVTAQLHTNTGHRLGIFHPLQALRDEIVMRYMREFGLLGHSAMHNSALVKLKALPLGAYIAGILVCLFSARIRRHPGFRVTLLLTGIHFCFLTFYEGMKFNYYLVHLLPLYACLLAIAGYSLWSESRRLRPALVLAAAVLIGVQAGGILMRARIDDFRNSYYPAAAYLQGAAAPDDLVMASCSLWFDYGPGRNLLDDDSLGYFSHKRPRYIVVEEIYEDLFQLHRDLRPPTYQHIVEVLNQSRLIYDWAGYKIYQTPPAPLSAQTSSRP